MLDWSWTMGLLGVAAGFTHQFSGGFESHIVYMMNKNASNQSGGWIKKNASNQSGGTF